MLEAAFKENWPEDLRQILDVTYRFSWGWWHIYNPDTGHDVADSLATTEFAVAMLTAQGWTGREIAAHMDISPNTVKRHLVEIKKKLGISNRNELKQYMLRRPRSLACYARSRTVDCSKKQRDMPQRLRIPLTFLLDSPFQSCICSQNRPFQRSKGRMAEDVTPATGKSWRLPKCMFIRTGHSFNSWNTRPDGSGTLFSNGAESKTLWGLRQRHLRH